MLLTSSAHSWTRLVLASALALLLCARSAAASYAPVAHRAGTAVDQAKRFSPSSGFNQQCALQCPGYAFDGFSKTYAFPMAGVESQQTTVCTYTYTTTPAGGTSTTYTKQCSYTEDGYFITGSGDTGCTLRARFADSCDPAVSLGRRRRELTPLERKIQARQWKPPRRALQAPTAR